MLKTQNKELNKNLQTLKILRQFIIAISTYLLFMNLNNEF